MEGNGGFTGTGHSLDNHCPLLLISDNLVLLSLNGGNDGFHLLIRGMAQLPLQNIILHIGRAFKGIFHDSVPDFKLPFSGKLSGCPPGRRHKSGRSNLAVIKQAGYGRAPVKHQRFIFILKGKSSDIVRLPFLLLLLPEINSGKIRGIL